MKLEEAKKAKFGNCFDKWKEKIITLAQTKSIRDLSSKGRLSLLTSEDHRRVMEENECIGEHAHHLAVTSIAQYAQGPSCHYESFDSMQRRLKEPDIVLSDVKDDDMKLFVKIMNRELTNNGYCCHFWHEVIRCKNIKMHYGIGREECRFSVTENVVEFEWPQPSV